MSKKGEKQKLMIIYDAYIQLTSTMNELFIAIVFGVFILLSLIQAGPKPIWSRFDVFGVFETITRYPSWAVLSVGYYVLSLGILYVYGRTRLYGQIAKLAVEKLGADQLAGELEKQALKREAFWVRVLYKVIYSKYGKSWILWITLGIVIYFSLWWAVAFVV